MEDYWLRRYYGVASASIVKTEKMWKSGGGTRGIGVVVPRFAVRALAGKAFMMGVVPSGSCEKIDRSTKVRTFASDETTLDCKGESAFRTASLGFN